MRDLIGKSGGKVVPLVMPFYNGINGILDLQGFWQDRRRIARHSRPSLIIMDNRLPLMPLSFRAAEYHAYLDRWPDAVVISSLRPEIKYRKWYGKYSGFYPQYSDRVFRLRSIPRVVGDLAYTIFDYNAYNFLEQFERSKIPFVFTLYPGGRFRLDDDESNSVLKRIFGSPCFKRVITTQKVTYEHVYELLKDESRIFHVYGGVIQNYDNVSETSEHEYYGHDKKTFDICFVAHKHMPMGLDKGYDVFIEVAKRLARTSYDFLFHVVGSYDGTDLDVTEIAGRVHFYGVQQADFFPTFYSRMDIFLSPNAPFLLAKGAFDGFPTGAAVEAGLNGVALLITDPLSQNPVFIDQEEIVVINRSVDDIVEKVTHYFSNPTELRRLAENGRAAMQREFSYESQLAPRIDMLSQLM